MDIVTQTLGKRPGKIFAVHLSYRSRAAQRGRTPEHPSYFFKAASSLIGSGTVTRPAGTELLGFEGEVAVVIGRDAFQVSEAEAWSHVGWVTASNDLGLHDLRYADKGSNVRSKSGDGFTPIGPELIDASALREDGIAVRTWVDGELVSDDTTAGMIFSISTMIADLSRVMTLERGDIILTGVPAGASVAQPGQVIEVEVSSVDDPAVSSGRLRTEVVEGPALAEVGSPPKVDDQQRSDAWGFPVGTVADERAAADTAAHTAAARAAAEGTGSEGAAAEPESPAGPPLDARVRERLENVAVATLSVLLRKRGYNENTIDGVAPLTPGMRIVGLARTLRYVPYRKDVFAAVGGGYNHQKQAVDSVGEGEVLVMEARRDSSAGTVGDILALRAKVRGAAGIITDGAARDSEAVEEIGLPVFTNGRHPCVLGRRHVPIDHDVTIACGGATVQVGDVIVADRDGALVIPRDLVEELLDEAEAQELQETFMLERVAEGASVDGLMPMTDPQWKERYQEWLAERGHNTSEQAQG